ncbi:MAG TPA: bifunctional phosphoribosyl-AMP cyclohydrolase/phosphoribosyl-ATP diphosphatase HisIE [Blattabacteriaceae bacterium]
MLGFKGLLPVIIQDNFTGKVLMLGYMNEEAYRRSIVEKKITFYSRSKKRFWTKGEKSGNYLLIEKILIDCDFDTLLIKVTPLGFICHQKTDTCWKEENKYDKNGFLIKLEQVIKKRNENSYISQLFNEGFNRIVQKFGEESIELLIEAKDEKERFFLNEAADMLFHYLFLINAKNYKFREIIEVLKNRYKKSRRAEDL